MSNQNQQVPPVNNAGTPPPSGSSGPSKGFMETLEYYLVTKAPFQIPANGKEFIVKFGPWINLIFLLTFLPLLLALIGLNAMFSAYSYSYVSHSWSIYSIISVITFVLGVLALPGLFKRKLSGWKMLFYEVIVSFVGGVISGNIIGAIIGAIVGLYVLFQVKSYYN